jgi:hypothetical protein
MSPFKILDARRVVWSKYHVEGPQIVGATVQNLVAQVVWRPEFVHPCSKAFTC